MSNFDLEYLLDCIELKDISVRSMFNTKLLYSNKIPFCMLYEGKLYIRVSDEIKLGLRQLGYEPLVFTRSFYRVNTQYYPFPDEITGDKEQVKSFVNKAYNLCQSTKEKEKVQRIRDLPNLQLRHERLLNKIGIFTVEEFKQIGADKAYKRLKMRNHDINIEMLYKLHGALQGKLAYLVKKELEERPHSKNLQSNITFKTTYLPLI